MDSRSGRCWVCDATGRLWCSACRFALYCSLACQKKDRLRHLDECVNSSRRRVCCNYCGREEALGGVPCPECVVATYCTDSCRKIDAKNHRSVCLQAKQKVVEAAKKINEWNRRAKGIPQYLGRLIHAVDYLRWSENEGARILAATHSPQHKEQTSDSGSEASKDSRNGRKENGLAQEMLRLLLLGADLKHVLCILHDTPDACTQPLEMVLVDSSPHILARDLLILYLLMLPDAHDPLQDPALVQAHAEKVVMVFYSLCLDMETHALLCNTLHNLLNMTHKTFLQEMRQQVLVDAGTYTLVQSVWSGWMSFANDPSALQKLENVRTLKVSGKMIKEVLARYIKSCPREHHKAVTDWIKRGSMKKSRGGNFPNVTLACFSPLRREYLEKFEDVSPKWSEETEWIKAVTVDDDMIYAPHGIDMIFQDWDFLILSRNVKKESNVVEMYRIYLTQVFSRASYKLLRSSQVLITFIRADVRELAANTALLKGKFDRIATGIHADLLGTPYVLQHFGGFLRTDNMYSRLLTHHRVWSLCLDWRSDQQARETCLKSLKCNRAPDPLLMITGRWATFRHFLQAELLHHLHVLDGRPLEPENVLVFKNVSHAYDMVLSDYTRQLNHIVPFRFQADKRMVSMVDSRLHTLEWRRLARTRRASAPAATNPAPKSLPTSPNHDIDPASRYVDNLIFLSQNPSSASPTSDSSLRRSINRREGSRSPSTVEPSSTSDDRPSRPRTSNRMRPRSLYVSTRCKSPLLSPEFDFWEHHNLIKEKKTPTSRAYNEIPEGISRRIQQALQGDTKQEKVATKSAPVSPELTRKTKVVKEKANAFERGTVARSTFPETRKTVETVTPSTPVKKLVSMFSKAFAAKDKEIDAGRKFKRSNSLHDSCLTPEEQNEIQNKSYNSLRITRSKSRTQRNGEINEAVECGMSTFPRRARPHSVASSKFSYLEGGTAKDTQASSPVSSSDQKYDLKKTLAVDTSDSPRNKKGHISPIRSLFAGLNTLSMSPILQRAADRQHSTPLKEELRLVHLRPVSQRFQSPPSLSLSSDNTDTMNLPESSSTRPNNDTPDTNNSARRRSSFDYLTDKKEPHSRKLPSPPWKSALKQTPKKIPHEPEYVAPSLHVNKEVGPLQSPTPDSNQSPSEAAVIEPETKLKVGMLITSKSEAASDLSDTQKENLPENIFSPRSSPNLYQPKNEESHRSAEKESCLMMEAQQLDEDDTISTSKSDSTTPSSPTKREPEKEDSTGWEEDLFAVIEETNVKKQNLVSQEDFTLLTSASLSSSLTDADMEVSELLSHQEQFCPIKDLKTDTEDESKSLILNQEEEKYTDLETERAQNAKDIQEKIKENFPVKDNTEPIDICKISAEEDIEKD
nr:uncharacterized protein LOC128698975 [Cherax quadricarinatus]XP_053647437.1 uncharacterized protein LOC128698975 [Cherax quadricarinatus]